MNFLITEKECNSLMAAHDQLNLVSGLLANSRDNSPVQEIDGLYAFLTTQADTLKNVVAAVDTRYQAAVAEANVMSWVDWSTVINVVSGRGSRTLKQLKDLTRKIQKCVQADPDMVFILETWMDVMTDGGAVAFDLEPGPLDHLRVEFKSRSPATSTAQQQAVPAMPSRKRGKLADMSMGVA